MPFSWQFIKFVKSPYQGDEADSNYQKVAKKYAKREHEAKDKSAKSSKKTRGHGYGRYPSYNPYQHYALPPPPPGWGSASQGWAPAAQGYAPPAAATPPNPRFGSKAHMRCNNCAEFGHFAKECTKPPLPPGSK